MMNPVIIKHETIYKGKIFDVTLVAIQEGGAFYEREIVEHPGSAVIVPVFADKTVALVKQYRHPAQKYLLEVPAGSLAQGENAEAGARRELEEEIGVQAGKFEKLTEFYVSPGFLSEKMYLFLATELIETKQNLEADEFVSVERLTFPNAFEMIRTGEIEDAKTTVGLILAGARFGFSYE